MRRVILIAAPALGACTHTAHGDPALRAQAHVPLERAEAIALAARAGSVTDWELERETGGSGLRYSFDITTAQGVFEVGVDAAGGAILENGPADRD